MKQGWEIKKLGEICESDLGKTLNQSKDKGELYPYLCSINVLWDKFDFTVVKQARFDDKELERYTVRKGDLLICEGGDIGRAAIWNQDNPILYQNALHRVRLINNDVIPRFVMLFLKYLKLSGVLDIRYGKGVTIKHLVKSSLLSIPIPVPERAEQERIVGELDCLSGIIAAKRAQLRELDTLAQSIFYTMFGDPITNDKGWQTKKLGDVCQLMVDGDWIESKDQSDNGIRLLQTGNVGIGCFKDKSEHYKFISEETFDRLNCTEIFEGDILISRLPEPIGRACIVPALNFRMITAVDCSIIRLKDIVLPEYVVYYTRSNKYNSDIEQYVTGAVRKRISRSNLSKINIPIPPIDLQKQFAEKIENIERQKELITKSIKETEDLFNSRMDYYFN